jgi:hypothetical protein
VEVGSDSACGGSETGSARLSVTIGDIGGVGSGTAGITTVGGSGVAVTGSMVAKSETGSSVLGELSVLGKGG